MLLIDSAWTPQQHKTMVWQIRQLMSPACIVLGTGSAEGKIDVNWDWTAKHSEKIKGPTLPTPQSNNWGYKRMRKACGVWQVTKKYAKYWPNFSKVPKLVQQLSSILYFSFWNQAVEPFSVSIPHMELLTSASGHSAIKLTTKTAASYLNFALPSSSCRISITFKTMAAGKKSNKMLSLDPNMTCHKF